MKLSYFEIDHIGPMFRYMSEPFARCLVKIGVRDLNKEAINEIRIDLVTTLAGEETLGSLETKILGEALRVLLAATSLLDGKSVQVLREISDSEQSHDL